LGVTLRGEHDSFSATQLLQTESISILSGGTGRRKITRSSIN
jgi:hypothetical protein